MLLNNLLCEGGDNVFSGDWRLYLAIAIVAAVVVGGIAVWTLKSKGKNYVKPYLISTVIVAVVYSIAVIIYSMVTEFMESKEDFMSSKYLPYMVAGIMVFIFAIILLGCLIDWKRKKTNNTVALVYAALCIAMSFALSYVRVLHLPQGGSITFASLLPLAIYAFIFGPTRGVVCAFIYGLLQSVQDPFIVNVLQFLLDYPLAFLGFGLAGVFKKYLKPQYALPLGVLIGAIIRYFCHAVSGAVFFGEFAPIEYSPWAWGFFYNLFVFADIAIVMVVSYPLMLSKQIRREFRRIELKYQPPAEEEPSQSAQA